MGTLDAEFERTVSDIKALRIQGARNVARAAMRAMALRARKSKAKTAKALLEELRAAADALRATRPTEPMMRNALDESLRLLFSKLLRSPKASVADLRRLAVSSAENFEKEAAHSHAAIAEFGAKEIPKGATILTHCHSSTVTAILKRAHAMGKNISAICCETRPLYQGRITAKELAAAGIPTTLIVDSAARTFIRDADLALVGADAITSSGELVNKIGTSMVAFLAYEEELKFYAAAELYKFDPLTLWGRVEPIEERSASEVADPREFARVKIRNPAFDLTPARHITAYITEHGVVAPGSLFALAEKHFDFRNPMVKEGARRKR